MRVIITGGSGFIGSALTELLTNRGHEVVILSRTPGRVDDLPENARAVGWDARTADGWGHLVDRDTAIVNLAGASLAGEGFLPSRWTHERRQIIRRSRLDVGQAVVAAVEMAETTPRVVIQSSAIGYYGTQGDERLTESTPPGDDFLAQVCVDWEASTALVEAEGVRRAIIRSGIVLSPESGALQRLLLPYRLFVGGPFGSGDQWYSWIHLEDEVRAIAFLIESESAHGAFNLTAPNPVTNATFGMLLGKVLNRPHWFPVPEFAMRTAFGEVAQTVVEGQRVIPTKLLEHGFQFRFERLEAALRDLLDAETA
jgi:uncharacterized protein (TIGR01777 family)